MIADTAPETLTDTLKSMRNYAMAMANHNYVRVELSEATIARLLASGLLCAAEINCLDCNAKDCIWRLALESCRSQSSFERSQDRLM